MLAAVAAGGEKLILGRVSGVYGVEGWVKVYSETDPRDGITGYDPWYLRQRSHSQSEWRELRVENGRRQAKTVIAKLQGVDDRDAARQLIGALIAITPDQLPQLEQGEYYWRDLIGMRVINTEGVELGVVRRLMETGANDVMVVGTADGDDSAKENLIPWTPGRAVLEVDVERREIRVDWDADF